MMQRSFIYLLDDNMTYRMLLHKVLEREGHRVESFARAKEALHRLHFSPSVPDLIISDLMMPEMDGLAFLDELNQIPQGERVTKIILSAKKSQKDIDRAFRLGCDNYLSKGLELNILLDAINSFGEQRKEQLSERHFLSLLEPTEHNTHFEIISNSEDTVYIVSETEYPLGSVLRIVNLGLKEKGLEHELLCRVEECHRKAEEIILTCRRIPSQGARKAE